MKAAIVKDEHTERDLLVSLLREAGIQVVGAFHSISALTACLQKDTEPDLLFIDIDSLGESCSHSGGIFSLNSFTIFMTSANVCAWKHIHHHKIDFLQSPFHKDDICRIINRQKMSCPHLRDQTVPANNLVQTIPKPYKSRLLIKLGDWYTSISTEEIAYVYTNDKLKYIRTFSNKDHLIDSNLEELEQQLDPHRFYRVNRQFLVNFKALDKILAWFDGKLKLTLNPPAHEDVIVSRLKAAEFKKWLDE